MLRLAIRIFIAFLAAWCLGRPETALAHKIITVGDYDYTIRISWLNEPALAGEKNAVLLEIVDGNTGKMVTAIPALYAAITVGGRKRDLQLNPLGENSPGQFAADVIPTVRGVYTLQLRGLLGTDRVDADVDMDEVEDPGPLQFPEPSASALELQKHLLAAEAAMRQAQIVAYVALFVSGLSLLAHGIVRYRRKARQP